MGGGKKKDGGGDDRRKKGRTIGEGEKKHTHFKKQN